MRLSIVNPYEQGGGAELQIRYLSEGLASRGGFEVAYHARFAADADLPRPYRLQRVGAGGRPSRLGYLPDAPALLASLAAFQPQVIYQRVACAWTGICAYYARRHRVRMVWHVAHDSDVMPDAHTAGANPLRRLLEKRAIEYGLRRADAIVVQTRHQAALLREHYGRDAAAVIPNFHPAASEAVDRTGPPLVAWIANLKPMKRPEVFVRLARSLGDIPGVRFVLVGADQTAGTPEAWRRDLFEAFAAGGNLQYAGRLPQEEVNALLARAAVFVNTSTQEGFPNTFIQAWQRGAVVCSLSVDPDGVLAREGLGVLAGDEAGLSDAVRRLLADPALRATYADRAARVVAERHGLGNIDRLVSVLRGGEG
jgi:glycosyltransferase involved in cell wall biosynthesis